MKNGAKKLLHLPKWWWGEGLKTFGRVWKNLVIFLDNKLAVSLMGQMLLVPLFHDTSLLGRSLSFIFRLGRLMIGSVVIAIVSLTWVFWLVVWLGLPIILTLGLKEVGWLILGFIWLIDILRELNQPLELKAETELKPGGIINYFSKQGRQVVKQAGRNSQSLRQLLIRDSQSLRLLNRLEIATQAIEEIKLLPEFNDWLMRAGKEAQKLGAKQISCKYLVLSLLKQEGFRYQEGVEAISWLTRQKAWEKVPFIWEKEYRARPMGGVNRAWTGMPTPTLDKFSTDLTMRAQKSQMPEIIGKEKILEEMGTILARKQKNNLLVIGEAGSGKTTMIKSIAQEIVRGVRNPSLRFKRLVALDTAKLAAGANSAELNYRVTKIVEEIRAAENIILFVDEVHNLASLNQDLPETSDLFIALEPALSEGAFQFIGSTSTENFKKYIEPNESFARLFEVVELEEASPEQTLKILEQIAWQLEKEEKVSISFMCLKEIVELAQRYVHERVFPDKGVNLLDEVVAEVKAQNKLVATSAEVEKLVARKTKVPVTKITKEESKVLLNLEKKLHERVIGQEQAVKAVAEAIRRARTGLKKADKPIASFIFAGPTGVGKTETAKTLAEEFFGSEKTMIRLDMSEYQNLDSLNRLIGAPPGRGEITAGGQLTEAVRHQPYTVVLLDEIEKAHPKILNLFLQLLDEGRLSDSDGKQVDFTNTIVIATTNVGTKKLVEAAGKKSDQELKEEGLKALEEHFAPEWLNRFTDLIVFQALKPEEVEAVVELKLKQLGEELARREMKIKFDPEVVKKLAEISFSPKWGGREIERVIQEKVMNVIAEKILRGETAKGGEISFSAKMLE